jgi:hypothetical protein
MPLEGVEVRRAWADLGNLFWVFVHLEEVEERTFGKERGI